MRKASKEFDFEKALAKIMQAAIENGMQDDVIFNTLIKEFQRMKKVCDDLYAKIEEVGVCYEEETFKGRVTFKGNPLVNEYVKAHKTLVATCTELNKILAIVQKSEDEEYDL